MSTVVAKTGITREPGWLYFVDKDGNAARVQQKRLVPKGGTAKKEVVAAAGVEKKKGFLYFITKDGDIGEAPMSRGGKKK